MDELTPDLSLGRWLRDFVLLGAGVGAMGPAAVLVPMGFQQGGLFSFDLGVFIVPSGLGGAGVGLAVGSALHALAAANVARPLWLAPLGFPVGFLAGGLVGAGLSLLAPTSATGVGLLLGLLGGVTGGLVLGGVWLPYLACKLRGRSGLPVVAVAVGLAGLVGPLVMLSLWFAAPGW